MRLRSTLSLVFCGALLCSAVAVGDTAVAWPQLRGVEKLRFDNSGTRLAALGRDGLQVWTAQANGAPGKKIWQSPAQDFVVRDFAWWGQGLLVSKTKDSQPSSSGVTLRVLPDGGADKVMLPRAYELLSFDANGKKLAAGAPTDLKTPDAVIDFFEAGAAGFKEIGQYTIKGKGRLGQWFPIWGWDGAASGIYAVLPIGRDENDSMRERRLFFVQPNGLRQGLLAERAPVMENSIEGRVYAATLTDGDLALSSLVIGPYGERANAGARTADIAPLLQGVARNPLILARSPNARWVLAQEMEDGAHDKPRALWLVDMAARRRRLLAKIPPARVVTWQGQWLAFSTEDQSGRNQISLLKLSEGALPADDPALLAHVRNWDDATPPVAPLTPAQQIATEFLRRAELSPSPIPSTWSTPMARPADWQGKTPFALGPPNQGSHFIVVDEAAKRVVSFSGLPQAPPLPDQPLDRERVLALAETFARQQLPAFFEATPPVEILKEISPRATYGVLWKQAAGAPAALLVEVNAGDGKIAAYREYATFGATEAAELQRNFRLAFVPYDSNPRLSPDGSKIAFVSNHLAPGYPSWWTSRPTGLWLMYTDGSKSRLLEMEVRSVAHWSPDNRRLAYRHAKGIHVYDLQTNTMVAVPDAPSRWIEQMLFCWLDSQRILLGWAHNGPGGCDLATWEPGQPQKPPVLQMPDWSDQIGNDDGPRGFTLSPDGKTLLAAWQQSFSSPIALFTVPVNDLRAKPRKIADGLTTSYALQWLPDRIIAYGNEKVTQINLETGAVSPWQPPSVVRALRGPVTFGHLSYSPDGSRIIFLGRGGWYIAPADATDAAQVVSLAKPIPKP